MVLDSVRRADSIEKANLVGTRRATSEKNEKPSKKEKSDHEGVFSPEGESSRKLGSRYARNDKPARRVPSVEMTIIDLNIADTTMLQQLPGIGGAYAKWIVDYREKLGGYCETEQLLEVHRMDTNRFNEIERFIRIDSNFIPKRLRINSDAFKALLKHPYLEYDNVKKIVNYREQKGMITSWEQLVKIIGDSVNPKLRYYIDYQ